MSKKSAFSHQKETQEKNEFEEKDEEEENEDEEQNGDNSNNNKTKNNKAEETQKEAKMQDDPLDYSDDEDSKFFSNSKTGKFIQTTFTPRVFYVRKSFVKKICSTRLENCLPHNI